MIERFLNLPPQTYTNNNKKHNCKKPLTIQNVNTRSNFPKTKSASKDQIRILAHEKNKKQGITSSKNKKDNIISLDNNKKQKILFQKKTHKNLANKSVEKNTVFSDSRCRQLNYYSIDDALLFVCAL
jgi:hypothetical protein